MNAGKAGRLPLPEWMVIKPASTEKYAAVKNKISSLGLHTVCEEARCPNITECWGAGSATFMVLGNTCTRGCRFCAVPKRAAGETIDQEEPQKLAQTIREWGLRYVVITSVCRDDLADQGSSHFARCVGQIRKESPSTMIELLIPDFRGDKECIRRITESKPDVIGHNIETVERLSCGVRDRRASYRRSLDVLKGIKDENGSIYTKSAMMLGIGETDDEIIKSMEDLRKIGVDFLAVGQYLRPSPSHLEVKEYVSLERFARLKHIAMGLGFRYVASGPFVRSSYRAGEYFTRKTASEESGHRG